MNVKSDGMAGYSMIYNENSIGRNSVTGNDFVSEISFARLKEAVLSKQNTKTITVTAIYFVFGLILWLFGILERNLVAASYGSVLIYDSANYFISIVYQAIPFSQNHSSTTEYPFGLNRLPVLSVFINALVFLYAGINTLKESLEHSMSGHDHVKDSSDDITTELTSYNTTFYVFLVFFSLLMTASSAYVNKTFHLVPSRQLAKRWQPTSKLQEVVMLVRVNSFGTLLVSGIILLHKIFMKTLISEAVLLIVLSATIFYLSIPVLIQSGRILIFAVSFGTAKFVDQKLNNIVTIPGVLSYNVKYLWHSTFNKLEGVIEIYVNSKANYIHLSQQVEYYLFNNLKGQWTVQYIFLDE